MATIGPIDFRLLVQRPGGDLLSLGEISVTPSVTTGGSAADGVTLDIDQGSLRREVAQRLRAAADAIEAD